MSGDIIRNFKELEKLISEKETLLHCIEGINSIKDFRQTNEGVTLLVEDKFKGQNTFDRVSNVMESEWVVKDAIELFKKQLIATLSTQVVVLNDTIEHYDIIKKPFNNDRPTTKSPH